MNDKGEIWRDIPGYEGLYQASDFGRVRSLPRAKTGGKILTPQMNNSGYHRVSITSAGQHKYLYVHHLVALAFLGPRPGGDDINHINGVKTDNRPENLEYATRSQNMSHARAMGLHRNFADGHYNAKLTSESVLDILYAHETCGLRGKEMAETLGVSVRAVDDVIDGKTWRSVHE